MSRKRGREEVSVDVQLIEIYDDLASERERIRVKAAQSLLSRFSDEADAREKILKRLVRGLASGRKSARVGFSVALTEILRQHAANKTGEQNIVTIPEVIDVLESSTRISDDSQGHETRDIFYGRLFGAAALVQSGGLFMDPEKVHYWRRVVDIIFNTARAKIWLREECGWVLYQAVKSLKNVPSGQLYVQSLMESMHAKAQAKTPEGVAIWIAVQEDFPETKMPKLVFDRDDPLDKKNKGTLARVLKQSSVRGEQDERRDRQDNVNGKPTDNSGVWFSKLHFVWEVVFAAASQTQANRITFEELWQEAVDDSLLSIKASPERKYWGLLLFQRHILSAPPSLIPSLFGPNLTRALKHELGGEDKYLNILALDVIDTILARSLEDRPSIPELVAGFLKADINFDRIARGKPIEKLIAKADIQGLELIVSRIVNEIDQWTGSDREDKHGMTSLADLLVSVFRFHDFPSQGPGLETYRGIVDRILDAFVRKSFLGQHLQSTQDLFKQRLMSSLNHITAKDPTPAFHPCSTIAMIRSRGIKAPDAEAEVLAAIEEGSELLEKIQKKESSKKEGAQKDTLKAFELLLAFALLQAYSGEAEAINTIDDLRSCYKSLGRSKSGGNEDDDVVALCEIIVEFVSRPSALYRRLAPKVLAPFASRITSAGLDVLLNVLATPETTAGQAELFGTGDEDAEEAGSDSDSKDSDIEIVDAGDVGVESGEEDDISRSGSSAGSSASPETSLNQNTEDTELAAFNAKLAAALGTGRTEDNSNSDASESDSDMSDARMEALDAQLGQIFRQRLNAAKSQTAKQQRRGARDSIANFKTKILELLEAYLKAAPRAPTALHIVEPVLESMKATDNRAVATRTSELVRTFSRLYKLRPLDDGGDRNGAGRRADGPVHEDPQPEIQVQAHALLVTAHTRVHEAASALEAKACSAASLLATKVFLTQGGKVKVVEKLYEATKKTLKKEHEDKFRSCFLDDWANWQVQAGKEGQLEGR